ncbi:MAG: AraC family transcriptional regulator [Verrucomicrobiota bacterium]
MAPSNWDEPFFASLANPAQLGTLLDTLPSAFYFAKDKEGRFTAINNALLDALGIADAYEVLGKTDYNFFDADLADAYRSEDQQVMTSKLPVINELWWVPNVNTGDIHWYCATKVPLSDAHEDVIGIAGIMRQLEDTTELTADHHQMTRVAKHIAIHYPEKLTVKDLSKRADLSTRQFQRVFKRIFRTSPIEYLNRIRVRAAAQDLLDSQKSLSDIALDCGFCDQPHFTNQFRRLRGTTPSQFRKSFGQRS